MGGEEVHQSGEGGNVSALQSAVEISGEIEGRGRGGCFTGGELAMSEIDELKRRIAELEDGSCRFNCRKMKESFNAGYQRGYEDCSDGVINRLGAYNAWLKERDEP